MCLLFGALPASAATLTWTFEDALFDDDTYLTGSFDIDTVTDTPSNWSLTVEDGTLSATTYDTSNSSWSYAYLDGRSYTFGNPGSRFLTLRFTEALTSPGTVAIVTTSSSSYECANCNPFRLLVGGGVTSSALVPEPAQWALMATGFGIVGGIARRRAARRFTQA